MGSWAELAPLKNVKASHKAKGADSEFATLFGEVEIHNDYDLDTFIDAEIDFEHIYKKLGLHRKKFDGKFTFRVRKIRGSIAGRYYSAYTTLIVDVKNMDSFIHELGHLLDYEWLPKEEVTKTYASQGGATKTKSKRVMLSKQEAFNDIKELYTAHFKANNGRSANYYLNGTEIFARSFELYIVRKFGDTTLTETHADYSKGYRSSIYPTENGAYLEAIDAYFDTLFGLTAVQ